MTVQDNSSSPRPLHQSDRRVFTVRVQAPGHEAEGFVVSNSGGYALDAGFVKFYALGTEFRGATPLGSPEVVWACPATNVLGIDERPRRPSR